MKMNKLLVVALAAETAIAGHNAAKALDYSSKGYSRDAIESTLKHEFSTPYLALGTPGRKMVYWITETG